MIKLHHRAQVRSAQIHAHERENKCWSEVQGSLTTTSYIAVVWPSERTHPGPGINRDSSAIILQFVHHVKFALGISTNLDLALELCITNKLQGHITTIRGRKHTSYLFKVRLLRSTTFFFWGGGGKQGHI